MKARFAIAALLLVSATAVAEPRAVSPPAHAPLVLEVEAFGVQIYACQDNGKGPEWVFKTPEANLFDTNGKQIGTHFAGPSWKLTDGSAVTGTVVSKADAPIPGAIPWLLLTAKSHEGAGILAGVATIRRANTMAGTAPTDGCDASHLGAEARMRYSATYQFFGSPK